MRTQKEQDPQPYVSGTGADGQYPRGPETRLKLGTSLTPTPKLRVERMQLLDDKRMKGTPLTRSKFIRKTRLTFKLFHSKKSQVTRWDGEMISLSVAAARNKPVDVWTAEPSLIGVDEMPKSDGSWECARDSWQVLGMS